MSTDRLKELKELRNTIECMPQTGTRAYGGPVDPTTDDDRYCEHKLYEDMHAQLHASSIPHHHGGSGESHRSFFVTLDGRLYNVFAVSPIEHQCWRAATTAMRVMFADVSEVATLLRQDKRARVTTFVMLREALRMALTTWK